MLPNYRVVQDHDGCLWIERYQPSSDCSVWEGGFGVFKPHDLEGAKEVIRQLRAEDLHAAKGPIVVYNLEEDSRQDG